MTIVELFLAIEEFEADSKVIISGPAGDYAPICLYEEDGTVYIEVNPIRDT